MPPETKPTTDTPPARTDQIIQLPAQPARAQPAKPTTKDPLARIIPIRQPADPKTPEKKSAAKEERTGRLYTRAAPLIVGGVILANQKALCVFNLEASAPPTEAMNDAETAVKEWIAERWGEGPKLSPFWEMTIALVLLTVGIWISSSKIKTKQIEQSPANAPPARIPALAPSEGAPVAIDTPPPRARTVGNADTPTTEKPSEGGILTLLDNPRPRSTGAVEHVA